MNFECEQFCRFTNRRSCTGSVARNSQMLSIPTYFLFPISTKDVFVQLEAPDIRDFHSSQHDVIPGD